MWAVVDALEWVRMDVSALCKQLLRDVAALGMMVRGLLVGSGEEDGSSQGRGTANIATQFDILK